MKFLVASMMVAVSASLLAANSAEAGKGKGKNNYASQTGAAQVSTPAKLQSGQFAAPFSPSQSYQGLVSGKLRSTPNQNSTSQQSSKQRLPAGSVTQTGLTPVPKLGFESTFGWHFDILGEHVTQVHFGSPAGRLGLEPGDAIVGVNGQELRTAECWFSAIRRAAEQDGWVTLKIVDGRSGRMAYRTANLFQLNAR